MNSSHALDMPPPLTSILSEGPAALFLDFDGTLVELAPGPDQIAPRCDLPVQLARLDKWLEGRSAIVSGRALADIEAHIGPLPIAGAGSHGSDLRAANGLTLGDAPEGLPRDIEQALRAFAAQNALDYEHKPHGGALHYRSNPEMGPRAHAFADELAALHGWSAQSGKCVVELVSSKANKGAAVYSFMRAAPFAGSRPFFIGDDLTDEAGFRACAELGGAGILVGTREDTYARYRLSDVASVHDWLGFG